MIVYGPNNEEMIEVEGLTRKENNLVIKGKIFGTMPMSAVVKPEEARRFFKLLDFKTTIFILTLLFRRSSKKQSN